jgi:hypothetical protein
MVAELRLDMYDQSRPKGTIVSQPQDEMCVFLVAMLLACAQVAKLREGEKKGIG